MKCKLAWNGCTTPLSSASVMPRHGGPNANPADRCAATIAPTTGATGHAGIAMGETVTVATDLPVDRHRMPMNAIACGPAQAARRRATDFQTMIVGLHAGGHKTGRIRQGRRP